MEKLIAHFTDIFNYHNHYNQKLIEQLMAHEEQLSDRTIPLLSNNMNAHHIWNSRINGETSFAVNKVYTLEQCKAMDMESHAQSLDILAQRDLPEIIAYGNAKGDSYSNTIQEILFHVGNHHTHHRGQIISDLRQNGIAPIVSDYIFYKR